MTTRWYHMAERAMRACGGWTGPATMRALIPRMRELYDLRLTTRAAGDVLAREYELYSSREYYIEMSSGREGDAS